MEQLQFLAPEEPRDFDSSRFIVVPCPYEKTTSYLKGTEMGPQRILEASEQVEYFDSETGTQAVQAGIHTLEPLNYQTGTVAEWLGKTQKVFDHIFSQKKFPLMLGGEHTISFPPIAAAATYHDISVLHFDAHSDMRDTYHGDKFSHASIMRRVHECVQHTYSVGVRAQCIEEREYLNTHPRFGVLYDHERAQSGLSVARALEFLPTQKIYVTIDLDYFAPEIMPSVGTPVPGGGEWYQTLNFLRQIFEKREVVGADIVELRPDHDRRSDFLAAQLAYKLFIYASLHQPTL